MIGLGLLIVWAGYTGFSYGNAVRKGATVTFSDMVLPSHRTYALGLLAGAGSSGATTKPGGGVPLVGPLGSGLAGEAGVVARGDQGIVAVGGDALKTLANGLGGALKAIGL